MRSGLGQTPPRPQDLFLTSWQPPVGQHCEAAKTAPSPAAAFDTLDLYHMIADLKAGSIVLSFAPADTNWREDYGPRPDSMAVVETTLPDTVGLRVRDALLLTLQRPATKPFLIRIDLTEHPVLQVARALFCPPAMRQGHLETYKAMLRSAGVPQTRLVLRGVVRPDGTITHVGVWWPSDDAGFDHRAVAAASILRFSPALINRVAIPTLVQFAVDLR